jgi:penicillin-binding protein 1A
MKRVKELAASVKEFVASLWEQERVRYALIAVVLGVGGLGVGMFWGSWSRACAGASCPSIAEFDEYRPVQSLKYYAADGRLITDAGESRTVLPLEEMSPAIPAAMLAIEDKRFFDHGGVDVTRCVFAAAKAALTLSFGSGGCSGISMQLARNIFPRRLPSDRSSKLTTIRRKVREIQVALELERTYTKERIIELYLNQIFLGGRAHGVEMASQQYFGKSAADLNVAEAASLAAMTQRPNVYDPRRFPERLARRRNTVINLMRDQDLLAPEEAEYWKAYPIAVSRGADGYRGVAQYFVEWVRQQVFARFGNRLFTEGYRIYTTLDLDMQLAAERALEDQILAIEGGGIRNFNHESYDEYVARHGGVAPLDTRTPYLQGALVTLDTNGYVLSMVGGRNYEESKFNRAVQALRQPGSTFKPFVFSAALRAGRPASYIIEDEPISAMQNDSMPWEPVNFEGDFRGPMTIREGLKLSRNLVAIRMGMELGVSTVVGEARGYGLTTPIPEFPSTLIGAASVLPIEMASAFTSFASMGTQAAPLGIQRVEDAEGNIVWEPRVRKTRVLDRDHGWILTDMLQDVVRSGTGYLPIRDRGQVPYDIPAAGKTGTTNDGSDVWYIGFTPELVTALWIGFDERKQITEGAAGGLLAAPAWAEYMNEVYSRRPAPDPWVRPSGLVTREVDRFTGYRATQFCPRQERYWDWFVPGTEPTEFCPYHQVNFRLTHALPTESATHHIHAPN